MARRATRPVFLRALLAPVCAMGIAGQVRAVPPAQGTAAVYTVIARNASGVTLATGSGFFIDTGRIVVPETVVAGASSVAVVWGGAERRATAVLAEDRRALLVLLAVDLPDGAPPSLRAAVPRGAAGDGTRVVTPASSPRAVRLSVARDVPGIGLVQPLDGPSDVATGAAVVDGQGGLLGAVIARDTDSGEHLAFVVPASRVFAMPPVGPLPLAEWSRLSRGLGSAPADSDMVRGSAAALGGRLDEAASAFEAAAGHDADNPEPWLALADCRRKQQRLDDSIAVWRRAIGAQPGNARFHHELGVDLSDAGQHDAAAAAFAEVVRLRPADPEARFNLGAAYGAAGRHEDEARAYSAALAIDPKHLRALKNLGLTYLQLQHFDEAIETFARAERLAPADPEIETGLGVSYFRARNVEAAITALRRALQVMPTFAKAHFSLGAIYVATGDRAAARAECLALRALDKVKGEQLCTMVDGR
jgi:tetratricopeptide (TPR) repeat protein